MAVLALAGLAEGRFRDDKCGKAEVWSGNIHGRIQCNYRDQASQHFKELNGVLTTWAYKNDLPHNARANGRHPRTEVTLENGGYTSRDVGQFSAQVFIPETTKAPFCLFQIKNAANQGTYSTTTAMIHHYNGSLKWYGRDTFARNVRGRWVSLNVVHDGPSRNIKITIDGETRTYQAESSVTNFGFKFGVYGIDDWTNSKEKFEASFKDVKINISGASLV